MKEFKPMEEIMDLLHSEIEKRYYKADNYWEDNNYHYYHKEHKYIDTIIDAIEILKTIN
jgi:hypothetical protein